LPHFGAYGVPHLSTPFPVTQMIRIPTFTALGFGLATSLTLPLLAQEAPPSTPVLEQAPQEESPAEEPPKVAADEAPATTLEALPADVAARGGETVVTYVELDRLLVERHGKRPEGLDVLNRMLIKAVLEELAAAAGIDFGKDALNAKMAELDKQLRENGIEGGLVPQLIEGGINPEIFQQMLRLSMIQAELTRIALRLPEGELATNGQQNVWMDETLAKRGGVSDSTEAFPTKDSEVVAKSGDATVTMAEFKERLRNELDAKVVEQACTQLLLQKVLIAEAGEVAKDVWAAAVDKELQRRRKKSMSDPQFLGTSITYEDYLTAQGLSLATMAEDPSVQVTALTTVLAGREALAAAPQGMSPDAESAARRDAGLRASYEAERDYYDGYFGLRLPLRVCMLRAVEEANDLVPRSIEQASSYLEKLLPGLRTEGNFVDLVRKISDEMTTKKVDGALGVYGRGDERLPEALRAAAWNYFDATPVPGVAGPLEVSGGVALMWIGEAIPAPTWAEMAEVVESELQRRILNSALPEKGIHVFRARL
jgi:hypothetical protein